MLEGTDSNLVDPKQRQAPGENAKAMPFDDLQSGSMKRHFATTKVCDLCDGSTVIFKPGSGTIIAEYCLCSVAPEPDRARTVASRSRQVNTLEVAKPRIRRANGNLATDDGPSLIETCSSPQTSNVRSEQLLARVAESRLPNLYVHAKLDESIHAQIHEWLERILSKSDLSPKQLLLYGQVGTGKTHAAVSVAKEFLLHSSMSVLYCTTRELFSLAESASRVPFSAKCELLRRDGELEQLERAIKGADVLIFDEVGIQREKSEHKRAQVISIYEKVIDARYSAGKITVFVSNHTFQPSTSLDGRTLVQQIGRRSASRLREAVIVEFSGEDRRRKFEVTQEDCPEFRMPYVGPDLTTVMHWIARNPVFQIVSDLERKALTKVSSSGELIERDRPEPDVFVDKWEKGTSLVVSGPKCGADDGVVFLALTQLYSNCSYSGGSGLGFETTLKEICSQLGKTPSGTNQVAVKRSLERLQRISIRLQNCNGRSWSGGLIDEVGFEGTRRWARVLIRLNPSMIPVYQSGAFSRVDIEPLMNLNSYGQRMQLFLLSHLDDHKEISLQKWQDVMGQSHLSLKAFRDEMRKAIKQQIDMGVLTTESCILADGLVVTRLIRSLRLTA